MNRRDLLQASTTVAILAAAGTSIAALQSSSSATTRRIRTAFMLGPGANVIDHFGPWEVFQDAEGPRGSFELFTVGASEAVVEMTGGLRVQPQYTTANAPQPDVIVVGAQGTSPPLLAWLRRASEQAEVTMSVCTGAFQLARAGLLDGIPATTHHDFWDSFAREFPNIELRRGPRFVDSGRIATAGGLTSGIDMALHVVERLLGLETAEATARYMEYASDGWRSGAQGRPSASAARATPGLL